ncbi:MAG TPA: hypothetical protein VFX03_12370 [Thermomicrobiales bacterium]|nr:hypothetical protein [Thermomicrobiales bacterium]
MALEPFNEFFLATAGAGGAFIGLLFVAISIHPQLTFRVPTAGDVPRQYLAEAALITLGNGFIVSCVALIPVVNAGWFAFVGGIWGVVAAARLAILLARAHRHDAVSRLHLLRVTSLSMAAVALYAVEFGVGVALLRQPASLAAWSALALVVICIDVLALARAWILLGDPQQGWSGWLNPLRDRAPAAAPSEAAAERSGARSARPKTTARRGQRVRVRGDRAIGSATIDGSRREAS